MRGTVRLMRLLIPLRLLLRMRLSAGNLVLRPEVCTGMVWAPFRGERGAINEAGRTGAVPSQVRPLGGLPQCRYVTGTPIFPNLN